MLIIKPGKFAAPEGPAKNPKRETPAMIEFASIMAFNELPVPIKTSRRTILTTAQKKLNPPIIGSSDTVKIPVTICTIIKTIKVIIVIFATAPIPNALSNQYRIKFIKIPPCFVYSKTSCKQKRQCIVLCTV